MFQPVVDYLKKEMTLRSWNGPFTKELVQRPGDFGLGQLPDRLKPDATTTMICGFCATGCGLNIHLKNGQAINLTATTDYPVNLGMACPKGWEALTPLNAPDRATKPLLRNASGEMEAVSWEVAIQTFVTRMKEIQKKHGNESIAFMSTGQIPFEEMAFLGVLSKFGMQLIDGDANTRQCMATSVTAYKQSFGFDAPPYTYQDFEESDALIFIGANPCIAHPIMWQRVCRNKNNPEIVVIDPRKTETAVSATEHFAIQPKSDLVLLYALANLLIQNGWIKEDYIEAHTTGFEGFKTHVAKFNLEMASKATGIAPDRILHLAKTIHEKKKVSFWWTMGVNQSHEATRTAQAIINLALMTGNIGRPGTGANSITGQCNAMGSRLFSNTTNLLGGHDFLNADHRHKIAKIMNIHVDRIPQRNTLAFDQILDQIDAGKIKALWLIATNSAHSWINQKRVVETFKKLDFVVVQDMYHNTESAQRSHLILPAAGWGEKEGCFINSERRIGVIKNVRKAPGEALADFHIFRLIAQGWGLGEMFKSWTHPEAAFQILKQASAGQPCDITGIEDYDHIDREGGIQWPLPHGTKLESNQRRLFADGKYFTPEQRAIFHYENPRPMEEPTDSTYPFLLLTGRGNSSQWHTGSRTEKSAVLRKLSPRESYIEINPMDALEFEIKDQDWISVQSRRGEVKARAFLTQTVQRGQLFMPMHDITTNQLTHQSFDPYSRQPSYKCCAVRLKS